MSLLTFFAGLILLVAGANALVRGASKLALSFGISPLVVGLTIVAFGTSAPELAVSAQSALSGQADIALGNVIGSNVFNILAILGISALVAPLIVSRQLVPAPFPWTGTALSAAKARRPGGWRLSGAPARRCLPARNGAQRV